MTDERRLLAQVVEQILSDRTAAQPAGRGELDRAVLDALASAGLLRLGVAEDFGGSGGTAGDAGEVVRLAGEYAVAAPVAEGLIAAWLLAAAGRSVPPGVLTVALDEAAVKDGSSLRRVRYGRHAEHIAGTASTVDGPAVFDADLIPARVSPGTNVAGEPRDDVELADLRMTLVDESVVAGARLRRDVFGALLISGAASRALASTIRYAATRIQFGRAIAGFQAVQQQVAVAAAEVVAARTAADAALASLERDGLTSRLAFAAAAAKARANQAAGVVASVSHQVHGAIGISEEHDLHRSTTRLWSWRDEWGRDAQVNVALVDAVDGDLWSVLTG
jgi:acyl-CoA dehydrogenase